MKPAEVRGLSWLGTPNAGILPVEMCNEKKQKREIETKRRKEKRKPTFRHQEISPKELGNSGKIDGLAPQLHEHSQQHLSGLEHLHQIVMVGHDTASLLARKPLFLCGKKGAEVGQGCYKALKAAFKERRA